MNRNELSLGNEWIQSSLVMSGLIKTLEEVTLLWGGTGVIETRNLNWRLKLSFLYFFVFSHWAAGFLTV